MVVSFTEVQQFLIKNTNGSFQYHGPLPHLGKFRGKGAIGNGIAQFITPELRMVNFFIYGSIFVAKITI